MNIIIKIFSLTLCIFCNICIVSAQNDIFVQGVIVSADSGKPIRNIAVLCDFVMKGRSDIDGRFSFVVARDAQLTFKSDLNMDYKETSINVDGHHNLNVMMESMSQEINTVTVVAQIKSKPLTVEPTELEVKGNYFHITPKLRIPYNSFKTDYRYVMQPTLVDETTGRHRYFRPLVINGKRYKMIMHRYLNFGDTVDPLDQFIVPNTITSESEIYSYNDSLYIESKDLANDFKVNCEFVMVSYDKLKQVRRDSVKRFNIANGTINPLRFFDYSVSPMQLDGTIIDDDKEPYLVPTGVDTMYIPAPELDMRGNKGVSEIEFEVGRARLNQDIASNRESINKVRTILRDIQNNPYATLNSIKVVGYASPEGGYEANLELANLRTKEFLSIITADIDPYNLERIKLASKGVVETWNSVSELAAEDEPELAGKVNSIIKHNKYSLQSMQWGISRLPEYGDIIAPRYLPRLRRMTYEIDFSLLRVLTYDEVNDKFCRYGGDSLSRYEYYTMIAGDKDPVRRDSIIDESLKRFPNFTIMANYKAVNLLRHDNVDLTLLEPSFDGEYTPIAVRYNQAIMALKSSDFVMANSLLQNIPVNENTEYLHKIVNMFNGNLEDAYLYFSKRGGLNEVLILLAMKNNELARTRITELINDYDNNLDAKYHYVAAVCANRMDDLSMATLHLNIALQIDPSLAEIAIMDGDIQDIYALIKVQNGDDSGEDK